MTIEELLEIEHIKNLRIMYSHYIDGGDVDKLAELFCEDAVCEFGEAYGGDWVGREAIRENYKLYAAEAIPISFVAGRRWPMAPLIWRGRPRCAHRWSRPT